MKPLQKLHTRNIRSTPLRLFAEYVIITPIAGAVIGLGFAAFAGWL